MSRRFNLSLLPLLFGPIQGNTEHQYLSMTQAPLEYLGSMHAQNYMNENIDMNTNKLNIAV